MRGKVYIVETAKVKGLPESRKKANRNPLEKPCQAVNNRGRPGCKLLCFAARGFSKNGYKYEDGAFSDERLPRKEGHSYVGAAPDFSS